MYQSIYDLLRSRRECKENIYSIFPDRMQMNAMRPTQPAMESVHVYEEIESIAQIISPCKRLKVSGSSEEKSSSLKPDDSYPTSTPDVKPVQKSRTKPLKVLQSEGQLKISAYMNFGLLTVHVVQARHLQSKWKPLCNSFVKMSLIPDDTKKSRCKTEMVIDSNNPLYDEKFSFELSEEDYNKRLMISVWHRDQGTSVTEFLGCMSFGICHLLNPRKDVGGWYYLLTEEIGRKKHLQVSHKQKPELKLRNPENIPQVNKDVWGMDAVSVTVHRGKHGFGFSVIESCPVKVGRVDRASPAESAGLQPGDCVVRVNSQNVSRSQAASVAKLVKHAGNSIVMDIQRPRQISIEPLDKSPWKQTPAGTFEQNDIRAGQDPRESSEADSYEEYKENEISVDENLLMLPSNLITSTPLPLFCNGHQTVMTAERRKQDAMHRLLSLELDFIDFMHAGMQRFSRPLRHCILSQKQHTALFQNIEKVVTISEYQVKQINDNRPSMLSSDTDGSLNSADGQNFMNFVGMIYQSKMHMLCQAYDLYAKGLDEANNVLSDLRSNTDFMKFLKDPIQDSRQPSISAFICRPVQHINDLYQVLREIFINTPADHHDYKQLKQVTEWLQECTTNITNYSCVARVQSLTSLTSSSSSAHGGQRLSYSSSASSSGSESGSTSSCKSTGRSRRPNIITSAAMVNARSVDIQVARIQDSLVFAPGVQPFQLTQTDRHLIFAGDLFRWEGKQWVKVYVMLFNDMLLETERERDNRLRVSWNPTYLRNVAGVEGHRKHTTELVLHLATAIKGSSRNRHDQVDKMLFRAPDAEQKYTWKSLLEQRVFDVRGSLDHYSSSHSDCSGSSSVTIL
ncbi:uncharacterized protein [Argopecten irradians]|uniref:uncharacterized protein isoform X1 n=2 Tax=Argopecten irradians TaxID=31199 RepID=UPI00371324E5